MIFSLKSFSKKYQNTLLLCNKELWRGCGKAKESAEEYCGTLQGKV